MSLTSMFRTRRAASVEAPRPTRTVSDDLLAAARVLETRGHTGGAAGWGTAGGAVCIEGALMVVAGMKPTAEEMDRGCGKVLELPTYKALHRYLYNRGTFTMCTRLCQWNDSTVSGWANPAKALADVLRAAAREQKAIEARSTQPLALTAKKADDRELVAV